LLHRHVLHVRWAVMPSRPYGSSSLRISGARREAEMNEMALRSINPGVPIGDVQLSVLLMLASVIVAVIVVLLKLLGVASRRLLGCLAALGLGGLIVIGALTISPEKIFIAVSIFLCLYVTAGQLAAKESAQLIYIRRRFAIGAACVVAALVVAYA